MAPPSPRSGLVLLWLCAVPYAFASCTFNHDIDLSSAHANASAPGRLPNVQVPRLSLSHVLSGPITAQLPTSQANSACSFEGVSKPFQND